MEQLLSGLAVKPIAGMLGGKKSPPQRRALVVCHFPASGFLAGLIVGPDFDAFAGTRRAHADGTAATAEDFQRIVDAMPGSLRPQRDGHLLLTIEEGDVAEGVAIVGFNLPDFDAGQSALVIEIQTLNSGISMTKVCGLSEQPFSWWLRLAIFTRIGREAFSTAPANCTGAAKARAINPMAKSKVLYKCVLRWLVGWLSSGEPHSAAHLLKAGRERCMESTSKLFEIWPVNQRLVED